MRIDFNGLDYIGDWIENKDIIIDRDDIIEDLKTIKQVPEEFDFEIFDIYNAALDRGIDESELVKIFIFSYKLAEIVKRTNSLIKRIKNEQLRCL